jgi:quercetin dioxygenase-like cupin family protein
MAVDDVMIVLEGQLTITANGSDRTASPGDIVYMPRERPWRSALTRGRADGLRDMAALEDGAAFCGHLT